MCDRRAFGRGNLYHLRPHMIKQEIQYLKILPFDFCACYNGVRVVAPTIYWRLNAVFLQKHLTLFREAPPGGATNLRCPCAKANITL